MGLFGFVEDVNAVLLEYQNSEGTIPQEAKDRFQYTYIGLCVSMLATVMVDTKLNLQSKNNPQIFKSYALPRNILRFSTLAATSICLFSMYRIYKSIPPERLQEIKRTHKQQFEQSLELSREASNKSDL